MTLDRRASQELEQPIENVEQLVGYLRGGEKPRSRWRVGIEHEKIGVRRGSWTAVDYAGPAGIEALLRSIAESTPPGPIAAAGGTGVENHGGPAAAPPAHWQPVHEDGRIIALDGPAGGITLEPGGQVELSGWPHRLMPETCAEFHSHLDLLRKAAEPFDIVWLGLGIHPTQPVDALPRVPRDRYRIMRNYLPRRGALALHMMHATASVQVSFDFASEADWIEKLRAALTATPIVAALFANSSISEGQPNGFVSQRLHIWRHTDPDRCGSPPGAFDADFGYRRYVEWALDTPMFFIVRADRYQAMDGLTFRRFVAEGHEGQRATLADFERHLTTLFPDVRSKRVLEVRCADAVPPDLLCTIPALWKGLLYDAEARGATRDLAGGWSTAQREETYENAARHGLAGRTPGGEALLPLARELVAIARGGLRRLTPLGSESDAETQFLEPLEARLERGLCPGEEILEAWQGPWSGSMERLVEFARY